MRFGYENFDKTSYEIGALVCFSEMVAAKVKKLAFSGAVSPDDLGRMESIISQITADDGIKYHAEFNLIKNNIAPDSYTEGKYVFFLYRDDDVLPRYEELKARQQRHMEAGTYDDQVRRDITVELCRLLSYPEERIKEKYML